MPSLHFEWKDPNPPELPITYRLYENGELVVSDIEATNFTLLMDGKGYGNYGYQITAYDSSTGLESEKQPPKMVAFMAPKPIESFTIFWEA